MAIDQASKVALRWVTATTHKVGSDLSNFGTSEASELSEKLKEVTKGNKTLASDCNTVATIYRSLVEPLRSPKIGKLADTVEGFVKSSELALTQLRAGSDNYKNLVDAWNDLLSKTAKEEFEAERSTEEFEGYETFERKFLATPEVKSHLQLAKQLETMVTKLGTAMDDFDWDLDGYLGYEAGILKKIQDSRPEHDYLDDAFDVLFGVVNYLIDPEYLEESLTEYREKHGLEYEPDSN